MIFQEGISSCRPRAANVSQTIFGIVDTTATKRYMMVMMMVIVIMMMVIIIMMMMVMMMNDDDDDTDDLYPRSHALKSGLSECSGEVVILTAVVHLVIVMIS